MGNSIEGIVDLGKHKILIDEIDSAHLKTFIKDIIVLFPCEFNEACEEYERDGWDAYENEGKEQANKVNSKFK